MLETSAAHQIPQAKSIPYQPLLNKHVFSLLTNAENTVFCKLEQRLLRSPLFTTNRISYKLACVKLVNFKAVRNHSNKLVNLLFTHFNSVFERRSVIMIINVCFKIVVSDQIQCFLKIEFSSAPATFFSVIRFCSDLIHARFSSLKGLSHFKR